MNDLINFISTITKKERLSSVADTNIRFWLTTIVCLQIFRKLKLTNNVEKSWKFLKYNFQKIFCVSRPVQSMQNVYPVFVAHPVYTASQVMKILLAAERVKYLTKSFSLENSLAASRSIRFSVDRRCTLLSPSLPPRVSPSNVFQRAQQVLTIEILRHTTNSRAHSRENQATLTVSSPIAHELCRVFRIFIRSTSNRYARVCIHGRSTRTNAREFVFSREQRTTVLCLDEQRRRFVEYFCSQNNAYDSEQFHAWLLFFLFSFVFLFFFLCVRACVRVFDCFRLDFREEL